MLECVVNISSGDDLEIIEELTAICEKDLLDVHIDAHHNRSVFTLLGTHAPRKLARRAVELLDLNSHVGVHPRLGVVDVVPFVPLSGSNMAEAEQARDDFALFAANELEVPVFVYGPERSLPDIRREAWKNLVPDFGPSAPHDTAGSVCVGVREVLVAYNVWLVENDLALAKRIAREIRQPALRCLGLQVGSRVQVSMNLVDPLTLGPAQAHDLVASSAQTAGGELVGLVPDDVLRAIPASRWKELDLSPEQVLLS